MDRSDSEEGHGSPAGSSPAAGVEAMGADGVAQNLAEALRAMTWQVEPERFALAGFALPPTPVDLRCLEEPPAQIIREGGETTLLAPESALKGILERHPEAQIETDLCWVRFEMPMSWELCGFLAHVTGALAEAEVPIGAVCGFSRDHLFVAERHLPRTREVLEGLFGPESSLSLPAEP